MPIRITGLNSGLDTEAIISALVSSYNYKTNKYKKAQTKLSWKQEKWKTLNTKIYSLYNSIGNMRFSSAYNLKKTTVSDTTKAIVKADGKAVIAYASGSQQSMGNIMKSLGCTSAINVDGGASTYLSCNGKTFITPGRNLTNMLVFTKK